MKANNVVSLDEFRKDKAVVGSYPIFKSPRGDTFECIGYAVQTHVPPGEEPLLKDWYLFEIDEQLEHDTIYMGLIQDEFEDHITTFSRSEVEMNAGVEISEDLKTLNELLPPQGWTKVK